MMPRLKLLKIFDAPNLLQLGDLGFTLPAAAAIAAALYASRARRQALCWCLLFGGAMLAVGLNKIAFMAWGAGIDALAFKAASGHAAGASAVLPLLFYLAMLLLAWPAWRAPLAAAQGWRALQPHIQRLARPASLAAGLIAGAAVAVQLVLCGEHTAAEAVAGWAIGAAVSWTALWRAAPAGLRPAAGALSFGAVFLIAAWVSDSLHVAGWMVGAARLLASGQPLHELAID